MQLDITSRRRYNGPPLYGPAVVTNHIDFNSDILDTQGGRGSEILVVTGTQTGNDLSNYCTPVLQESDTTADADFTAVAASDIVGQALPGAIQAAGVTKIGYVGMKRYIRVKMDFTSTGVSSMPTCIVGAIEYASLMPGEDPSPITAT